MLVYVLISGTKTYHYANMLKLLEREKGVEKKEAELTAREAALAAKLAKTPAAETEGEKATPVDTAVCLISGTKTYHYANMLKLLEREQAVVKKETELAAREAALAAKETLAVPAAETETEKAAPVHVAPSVQPGTIQPSSAPYTNHSVTAEQKLPPISQVPSQLESLSLQPSIQSVANPEQVPSKDDIFLGWRAQLLDWNPVWYNGEQDLDIVIPPLGVPLRRSGNSRFRPGVIIDNGIQLKLNVGLTGRTLCCPVALEGKLRQAMETSQDLSEDWLKLRENNKQKWIPDTAAKLEGCYDQDVKDDLAIFHVIEFQCQHVHWKCNYNSCCEMRDWEGVLKKATINLNGSKVRLEGVGNQLGWEYFSEEISLSTFISHIKIVQQRSHQEILSWLSEGGKVSEAL
jgi:hypothetical protein